MRLARGGFQRWPRAAQGVLVQFILLIGILLGAQFGILAFTLASVTFAVLWTNWLLTQRRKLR